VPRRIDIEKRKERLAEAVWTTIRERGIGAVSVRTVAAEAGVAVGSLRHVFPTRAELLRFSAELMVRRATDRVLATPRSGDPVEDATALLLHMLPLEPDSRAELEVNIALIAESPALPEVVTIRDHAHHQLGVLCERVVAMLAAGVGEVAATREARRLHAIVDGIALHLLMEPEDADPGWAVEALHSEITRIVRCAGATEV
jgi:AcrR family transcriptional regulator